MDVEKFIAGLGKKISKIQGTAVVALSLKGHGTWTINLPKRMVVKGKVKPTCSVTTTPAVLDEILQGKDPMILYCEGKLKVSGNTMELLQLKPLSALGKKKRG